MQLGISSYSLQQALNSEQMSILDVISWVKETGAEHIEIVPLNFDLLQSPEWIEKIKLQTEKVGLPISNYAISANLLLTGKDLHDEMTRIKKHVDITHQLHAKNMRFDVGFLDPEIATDTRFEADLPSIISSCQLIADYAKKYDFTISIENHGYYIQKSKRLLDIVSGVQRDNFKLTLDVGNFLCVDEQPLEAVSACLPYASMIHLKDFYYRKTEQNLGTGFFKTANNNQLRGAITGHGDLPLKDILTVIKKSSNRHNLSIEFEGLEPCQLGTTIGFNLMKELTKTVLGGEHDA